MQRKIDSLGRLVIPKEMRRQLGVEENGIVNLKFSNDEIIIYNPEKIGIKSEVEKLRELSVEKLKEIHEKSKENQELDSEEKEYWFIRVKAFDEVLEKLK